MPLDEDYQTPEIETGKKQLAPGLPECPLEESPEVKALRVLHSRQVGEAVLIATKASKRISEQLEGNREAISAELEKQETLDWLNAA